MKILKLHFLNKKELLVIIIGIILSLVLATKNLEKFDKVENYNSDKSKHLMLKSDMKHVWQVAEKFRLELSNGKSFFDSLPLYDRAFLQPILVGYFYHILDKEIFQKNERGEFIIKTQNFKFGILVIQILIFYIAIYFFTIEFSKQFSNKKNKYNSIIILAFLSIEPSILQWQSSFWSESLFLSLMIILFTFLIRPSQSNFLKFFIGILIGLMYSQKAYSFFYIFPVLIFFFLLSKKKLVPPLIVISGYFLITLFIGFNHYKKTNTFYMISSKHEFYSYYHYFAHLLYADRNGIGEIVALKKLNKIENDWRKENDIQIFFPIENTNAEDLMKNIKYRNKFFLNEIKQNPSFFIELYFKRTIAMSILSPTNVYEGYNLDKSSQEAKDNPKEYFNKNLNRNIIYSIIIYSFVLLGFKNFLLNAIKKRKLDLYDKFLILNLLSLLYFLLVAGLWGNPRYFTPCLINISFFFAHGLNHILIKSK